MRRFEAPIPGQSLTGEPKKYAWERPPEITDPEIATQMHLIRLSEEKRLNTVLDALEFGVTDLYTMVKGMMRSAVANGIHTIDVGMIVAPVVHEFLKQAADEAGIEYDDGMGTGEEEDQRRKMRASLMAQKKLKQMGMETPEEVREAEPNMPQEEPEMEPKADPKRRGLMSREEM